ncbi:MAG: hypothetical protein CL920_30285 [Deltaproteobacteria bacterium]|nr:hypothetical protein [Deltaproteobacteria bacterium]MBU53002.1 hypothetical protein [Deltaproteobacteria bacterium]|tara:strand:+ start:10452 stop:11870 length:1419 start_codon:yes stop_codon:yes gene_type:complete
MSAQDFKECDNCGHRNTSDATFCGKCGASFLNEEDPFIGRQVGRCILKEKIGLGGSGAVYKGVHSTMGRIFAVKVLHADLVTDEESKARFEREVQVLAGMHHKNIVSITDSGYVPGIGPYMEMEWLEGSTLFGERKRRKYLDFDEILWIVDQMTDALSFMHDQGIVHRDLKPENMMLIYGNPQQIAEENSRSLYGRILKIFDFGIALLTEDSRKLTAVGMVVGTPHYMAPEQIIVDAPVDHRADLYAVGAIIYELLCGQPPFWGAKKPVEVMERHLRRMPPPLHDIAPERDFPAGIEEIMRRALAKNPIERFQDARELYDALSNVLRVDDEEEEGFDATVVSSEGNHMWEELQAAKEAIEAGTFDYNDPTAFPDEKTTPGTLPPVQPPFGYAPNEYGANHTEPTQIGFSHPSGDESLPTESQPGNLDPLFQQTLAQPGKNSSSRSLIYGAIGVGLGMIAILIFYLIYINFLR